MKTFNLNLQTILFMTDISVLGAYNKHNKVLVYNKPLVTDEENMEMLSILKGMNLEVKQLFQTDSFGLTFYNHVTGGSSTFHEVTDEAINQRALLASLGEYLVSDNEDELLRMYEAIKNEEDQEMLIDHVDDVDVWANVQLEFTCREFVDIVEAKVKFS